VTPLRDDLDAHGPAFRNGARYLVSTSTAGLCNRLLNLAGCMRLAEAMGRRLVLHWPADGDLGCEFGDLFENAIEPFGPRHAYELLHTQNTVTVYHTSRKGQRRPHYRFVRRDDDAHLIVVKGWGSPRFRWELPGKSLQARPFLKSLVPVAELRERIAAAPALEDAIGVHVRRVDVPASFRRSRVEDFLAILRRVVARRPDARFHLATDDAETERRFRDEFGDRIHTLEKSTWGAAARSSAEGMKDAVVDLYRLARTRAILGNDHSTFSVVASLLGPGRLLLANAKNAGTDRRGAWERLCGAG
jgi:hypothetical protein